MRAVHRHRVIAERALVLHDAAVQVLLPGGSHMESSSKDGAEPSPHTCENFLMSREPSSVARRWCRNRRLRALVPGLRSV